MKHSVIFDSSSAILLAKISILGILAEKINIVFPESVKKETTAKKDSFDSKLILTLIEQNKLKIIKVNMPGANKLMRDFNIGEGEAEAILLAKKEQCVICTDDGPSIKACKILGLKFATAIHFLIQFYEQGLIDKPIAVEKLRLLEKFGRYGYEIIKDAKNKIEGE